MNFRFPDDPNRISVDYLKELTDSSPEGELYGQVKSDGWRRPGYKVNGKWSFYAKRGIGEEAAKQPPADLVAEMASMGWPDNIAFDMEWMGTRCKEQLKGVHHFRIFDLLYLDGVWQGKVPFRERYSKLRQLFLAAKQKAIGPTDRIVLVEARTKNLSEWFQEQKQDPLSEGLVVRRAGSGLIGDIRKNQTNPQWFKIKYRDIKEPTAF